MPNRLTGGFDIAIQFSVHMLNRFLAAVHQNDNSGPMTFLHSFETRIVNEAEGVSGRAEVQVGPPRAELLAAERAKVHYPVMAHWIPDSGSVLPELFLHGDLQVTAGVHQWETEWETETGRRRYFLDFNLQSSEIEVSFNPAAGTELRAEYRERINRVLHGFMRSAFPTENVPFDSPPDVYYPTFKAMPGERPAVTLLLNLVLNLGDVGPPAGAATEANQVFLSNGDDFAVAISSDYILPILRDSVRAQLERQLAGQITGLNVNVVFQTNQLQISVSGSANTFLGGANIIITQALRMQIRGNAVVIEEPLPNPGVSVSGNFLVNLFSGIIKSRILSGLTTSSSRRALVDAANGLLSERLRTLDVNQFFNQFGVRPTSTTLTNVDIHPEAVVLHGTVTMPPWHEPHVEQRIPVDVEGGQVQFNAFGSWIPGGRIESYKLTEGPLERHRFITRVDRDRYTGRPYQVCLTITGKRIRHLPSPYEESVTARTRTFCVTLVPEGLNPRIPLLEYMRERRWIVLGGCWPPDQWNAVRGYIDAARLGQGANRGINTIIHFTDGTSMGSLDQLRKALQVSGGGAAVSLLAVIPEGQLGKLEPFNLDLKNAAFAWSEDNEGGWRKGFQISTTPATFVINPSGNVVWNCTGETDKDALSTALREHLVPGGTLSMRMLQLSVKVGEYAPDFPFEYAPGQEIALRKLKGRPVVLAFWQSWSRQCIEELRPLDAWQGKSMQDGLVVLAISDDRDAARARQVFKDNGFTMTLVSDTSRRISQLYNTVVWPTTVSIDPNRVVTGIQMGVSAKQQQEEMDEQLTQKQEDAG